MDEYDSPNYTEFTYEKRAEGRLKIAKILFIVFYFAFFGAFFAFCAITGWWPLFGVSPLLAWMLVFFTWRYVSYDVYYTFNHGQMEFGKVKVKKSSRHRNATLSVTVNDAKLIAPYDVAVECEQFKNVKYVFDYFSHSSSQNRIALVFNKDGKDCAVIFEGTDRVAALLHSFCKHNSRELKSRSYFAYQSSRHNY